MRDFINKLNKPTVKKILFIVWIIILFSFFGIANAQLPGSKDYNNITYITGGFGLDESNAIKAAMPEYSAVFTFVSSDKGRSVYVSKVQLVIRDNNDYTVFNAESDGPFLLAQIPSGKYMVHATYKNKTLSRSINITQNKSNRIIFDWPFEHEENIKPAVKKSKNSNESNKKSDDSKGLKKQDADFIPGLGVNPRGTNQAN